MKLVDESRIQVLHASGVSERRQVGIEATCVAILVGYNPSSEMVIPTTTFANSSSMSDYVDPSFQDYLRNG